MRKWWIARTGKTNKATGFCVLCKDTVSADQGELVRLSYSYGYKNTLRNPQTLPEFGVVCTACQTTLKPGLTEKHAR